MNLRFAFSSPLLITDCASLTDESPLRALDHILSSDGEPRRASGHLLFGCVGLPAGVQSFRSLLGLVIGNGPEDTLSWFHRWKDTLQSTFVCVLQWKTNPHMTGITFSH